MSETVVGFAGMTHLGINSAVATAARGFSVICFDPDRALVDRLRARALPIAEPELDDLLAANATRIDFTGDVGRLGRCDVLYIAADVPTDDEGASDLAPIERLIAAVAGTLRKDAVLVILCQVPPGFTRRVGAVAHPRLFYQVETLIFGRAIERALHPERFIVGCADPAHPLPRNYRTVLEVFSCPILQMRYESAELAKISINFCLVASLTAANVLAEVSEAIGADWLEIVPALRLDQRIGPKAYLTPGLGISGGNLERDLRTVLRLGEGSSLDLDVVKAWIGNSRHRKDWCWRVLRDRLLTTRSRARIAVLGLAYKENTHSTKNSPSLALLRHIEGQELRVHDPVVPCDSVPFATGTGDPLECAKECDACVIATPWPCYREIALDDLARVMRGRLLVDPYRMLDGQKAADAGFEYWALGMAGLGP